MIRTQVYLPKVLYQLLQLVAKQDNRPTAEVIRELLGDALARRANGKSIGQALLDLSSIGGQGPKDLSSNIDKYLYEE